MDCSVSDKEAQCNYLDNYLFAADLKYLCDEQMRTFLNVCKEINFQVALEKTFWGTTLLTFLGMLLDTEKQIICIPMDKLVKAMNWIDSEGYQGYQQMTWKE